MVYTFKTSNGLVNHLRALAQLSASIEHSPYPLSDLEVDIPFILANCLEIKKLSHESSHPQAYSSYVAFRTCGFEFSTSLSQFRERVTSFRYTVIATYRISFVHGYYTLEQINL